MVTIPAGSFRMGSVDAWAYPGDGEGPIHVVELDAFELSVGAVRNDEFAAFVAATGHVTDAERFGWSFVFAGLLPDDFPPTRGVAQAPWWRQVEGADWRHPEGPHSGSTGAATTRCCTCRGATPWRSVRGRVLACRPKPSGSTPPAAGTREPCSRGATSSSRATRTA